MKAIVMQTYGSSDALSIREVPEPHPGKDEVVVEVFAAALNPVDIKICEGKMRPLLQYVLPLVPGNDIAGRVVQVGDSVTRFSVGDEVYATLDKKRLGAFAQYVAVAEDHLALKPKNLTHAEAASLPLVALTVYQALHEVAHARAGQKIFIKAGSGGIGTFAIQYARACGLEVATTTSPANRQWVRDLGAGQVIDYRSENFERQLHDYDIVLDSVDNDNPSRALPILKPGGHLISLVGPPDGKFARQFGLNPLVQLACSVLSAREILLSALHGVGYSFLFVRPSGEQLETIGGYVERGEIRPVVDRIYSFADYHDAFAHLATGRAKGKIVLALRDS